LNSLLPSFRIITFQKTVSSQKRTFKERLDDNPVWVILQIAAAVSIATGAIVFGATYYFLVEPLRRESSTSKPPMTLEASPIARSQSIQLAVSPTAPPLALASASPFHPPSGAQSPQELQLTYEEFRDRYLNLATRYREKEEFINRASGKKVHWVVTFRSPMSGREDVTIFFQSSKLRKGDSDAEAADRQSPVSSAVFPLAVKDRIFSLQSGDVIEIDGTLRSIGGNNLIINADDFGLIPK